MMYSDPEQRYAITHWDGSTEIVRAVQHPDDESNVIRILYADGVCHTSSLEHFTLTATPVTIN